MYYITQNQWNAQTVHLPFFFATLSGNRQSYTWNFSQQSLSLSLIAPSAAVAYILLSEILIVSAPLFSTSANVNMYRLLHCESVMQFFCGIMAALSATVIQRDVLYHPESMERSNRSFTVFFSRHYLEIWWRFWSSVNNVCKRRVFLCWELLG